MATQNFDQLNSLRKYAEMWYSDTDMPQEKKRKRIDLCMEYADLMLLLFLMITEQELEDEYYISFLTERLKIIAENYIGTEDLAYVNDWSKKQAKKIVEDTNKLYEAELDDYRETEAEEGEKKKAAEKEQADRDREESDKEKDEAKKKEESNVIHFEEFGVDIPKDEYPLSELRACLIAIECVTSISNYDDYFQAYREGRHHKVWQCGFFKKSRETHQEAHGQDTNIDKPFYVGNSMLTFPGDLTYNPEMKEIYGCKCWCEYYK